MTEFIHHEPGNPEAWVCLCGNTPSGGGFYPIDENKVEIEPIAGNWPRGEYVCAKCLRVIKPDDAGLPFNQILLVTRRLSPGDTQWIRN